MDRVNGTELTFVRHGETVWNLEGRMQGHMDSALSELGLAQARAVAEALAGQPFDAIYSSDLGRARRTADISAERIGLEVRADAGLRERNLGLFQGLTGAECGERHPEEYARFRSGDPDYVIPGGESVRQRIDRAVACGDEIARRHPGGRIVLVAHGGVLDAFFRHTLGLDIAAPRRYSLYNAAINVFFVADGQWRLDTWGQTSHLADLGTIDDY